jgi:hypothetical protein
MWSGDDRSFRMLLSLSKPWTEFWLSMSEWTLLICGILLSAGVLGEYLADHKKKEYPFFKKRKHLIARLIIMAIAGELFADGGIFFFGDRLQTIADFELGKASKDASAANKQAGLAILDAARASERAAITESNNLILRSNVTALEWQIAETKTNVANIDPLKQPISSISATIRLRFKLIHRPGHHPVRTRFENDGNSGSLVVEMRGTNYLTSGYLHFGPDVFVKSYQTTDFDFEFVARLGLNQPYTFNRNTDFDIRGQQVNRLLKNIKIFEQVFDRGV